MTASSPEGLLIIDKPAGITSHDVVSQIRRLAQTRRVGHAGTLDPLATGVLILCLGRATRLLEYVTGQHKVYEATLRLGQTTDTYDAEGDILTDSPVAITESDILTALPAFQGEIAQVPPMYSALKKQGQPLYKLARQGITVEREARPVTIYEITLLWCRIPHIALQITCGAGTYIRSLAHDLGQALGCGAYLTALKRTAIGDFTLEKATPLAQLTPTNLPNALQPMDHTVAHLPAITVTPGDAQRLQLGQKIPKQSTHPTAPLIRLYAPDQTFIGLATSTPSAWQPKKILA